MKLTLELKMASLSFVNCLNYVFLLLFLPIGFSIRESRDVLRNRVSSMVSAVQTESSLLRAETTTRAPYPCTCFDGICSCCTGFVLGQFGYNVRQRGCMNVTYDPDEFAFTMVLAFNDRLLYKNTFSGKNPEPACASIPRVPNIKLCAVFSNVYFSGRNLHMCIDMEGRWLGSVVFKVSFDCIRIGANGVAVIKPEDGGGLPVGTFITGDEDEYDNVDEDEEVL